MISRGGGAVISGVWLRGGKNTMDVLVERDGRWVKVISEFVPLHGNDGSVWPISHIAEQGAIENGEEES